MTSRDDRNAEESCSPRDLREPWPRPRTDELGLTGLMAFVRARCPWASAHTHASLATYLVEESVELLAAEEQLYSETAALEDETAAPADEAVAAAEAVEGEIADVLYQVLFHSALLDDHAGRDPGETFARVNEKLAAKLVRRHPHVFDSSHPVPLSEVQRSYRQVKQQERSAGLLAPEPEAQVQERALGLARAALAATEQKIRNMPADTHSKESR